MSREETRWWRRQLALLVPALLAVACVGSRVGERATVVDRMIDVAREQGAVTCAPVELATAEANNDFARQELSEGNLIEARRAMAIAETNAQAALEKSPKDRCARTDEPNAGDSDGDGILDPVDRCPKVPEDRDNYRDDDGCPDDDNDADGVADVVDKCPNDPEDLDGYEDRDGCPDADNDGDGLLDRVDNCPDQPEDKDGLEDDDGCPDCDDDKDGVPECPDATDKCPGVTGDGPDGCKRYQLIVVKQDKIELKQTIYFDFRKATIRSLSFPLLNEVAQAMADNPTLEVRIEGHTDSRGSDRFNLKLSQRRADSVRMYLVGRGVTAGRMVARGFGETAPIADNRTQVGRDMNRRVEFVITAR